MKNFYEEKLVEIKELIKKDKEKALEMLNDELKMPYIPEKYESQFVNLADELTFELKGDSTTVRMSRETIVENLFSEDPMKVASAIEALRTENIRTYLEDIERWLFINTDNKVNQGIIYELLVEQQIDKEIKFGDTPLNPAKGSIVENINNKRVFEEILSMDITPQVMQAAINEFNFYLLKTFPNFVSDESFAQTFVATIENIIQGDEITEDKQKEIFKVIKQN